MRHSESSAEARTDGILNLDAGKMRGAHASREREPGKRCEFIIKKERRHAANRLLTIVKQRRSALGEAEEFIIPLIEPVVARLQGVLGQSGTEAELAPGILRGTVVRRCIRDVGRQAVVVSAIEVVEGRNREQQLRVERVHPGEIGKGISFVLCVAETDSGILRLEAVCGYWRVLDVAGERIVGNLIKIAAKRRYEAKLIGRIDVENQRSESAVSVLGIVDDLRHGWLQSKIAAIAVYAGVVGEALGVVAERKLIVGLIEIPGAQNEFSLAV